MTITRSNVMTSLANPGKPFHVLYDREAPRATGWTDAAVHAKKATDRLFNGVARVGTPFVGAVVLTEKALKQPGWRKAAIVPAPVIGLVGGTLLGAGGFLYDTAHVLVHAGGSVGNAVYAVGHNGFEALYEDAVGIFRAADAFAAEDTQTGRRIHRERAAAQAGATLDAETES